MNVVFFPFRVSPLSSVLQYVELVVPCWLAGCPCMIRRRFLVD